MRKTAIFRWLDRIRSTLGFSPKTTPPSPLIPEEDKDFRHLAFTYAVIALSAKIACCSGVLTREKYVAFRESFPLSGDICSKIRSLFTLACENPVPFEHYVIQIKYAFPGKLDLFASLVDRLFIIATAGTPLSPRAERMLENIAQILHVPPAKYNDIRSQYGHPGIVQKLQARRILGVTPDTKSNALKKRYRELMSRYHPDRFARESLSPEIEMLLQLKTSEINAAYKKLSKKAA